MSWLRHGALVSATIVALGRCTGWSDEFQCIDHAQCVLDDTLGRCDLSGLCSFEDDDCPSGRRYGDHSGALSGECTDDPCLDGALPCISGTRGALADGGTLLIFGRGFGEKDVGAVQLFDFEASSVAVGASVGGVTAGRFEHYDSYPIVSDEADKQRAGSTKNLAAPIGNEQPMFWTGIGAVTGRVFVNLWVRWVEACPILGLFDLLPLAEPIDLNNVYPQVGDMHRFLPLGEGGGAPVEFTSRHSIYAYDAADSGIDVYFPSDHLLGAGDQWISIAVQIDEGVPPDQLGRVMGWLSSPGAQNPIAFLDAGDRVVRADASEHLDRLLLLWWNQAPVATTIYLDDIYFDTAWSRIEIGDAPVHSDCHRRELQLPEAWSESEVTIRLRQGELASLAGSYLFVVDADGNASAGFPL